MRRNKEGDQSVWRVRVSQMNGGLVLTRNTIAPVSDLLIHWQVNTVDQLIHWQVNTLSDLLHCQVNTITDQCNKRSVSVELYHGWISGGEAGGDVIHQVTVDTVARGPNFRY